MNSPKQVTQDQLKAELIRWSSGYKEACKESMGLDFEKMNLSEVIIEYDWDTEFLWLATHMMIHIHWGSQLNELKTTKMLGVYSQLVSNTLSIVESFGVDEFEAIQMIPNFFIRLYDYMINSLGSIFKFEDDDLDKNQFEGWYGLRARDLIDEKQSADTNSYDPERMLESLKNFANESLKGEDARWIKGIIENNKKFTLGIYQENPNPNIWKSSPNEIPEWEHEVVASMTNVACNEYLENGEDSTVELLIDFFKRLDFLCSEYESLMIDLLFITAADFGLGLVISQEVEQQGGSPGNDEFNKGRELVRRARKLHQERSKDQ